MHTTLLLTLTTVGFPLPKDKPVPQEVPSLVGEWKLVEFQDGENLLALANLGLELRMTFEKNAGTINVQGQTIPFTYSATAGDRRHLLDITPKDGAEKDRLSACIFKIEHDTLTICSHADMRAKRPDTFAKGAGIQLMVFQRIKK